MRASHEQRGSMIKPLRLFVLMATLFGLAFVLATPPVRFPDENGHYLRAALVAGNLFGGTGASGDRVLLPKSVAADLDYFSGRAHQVMHGRPFDLAELTRRIQPSTLQSETSSRTVPAAQMIPGTIGYLPQAVAFAIASRAGATFVTTLWTQRLAGLVTAIGITALALMLMPAWARWTSVSISLLPMAVYMRAALSPDAAVTAVTLLGVAALLDGARREDISLAPAAIALVACVYLALVKPPYICILLLSLLWLRSDKLRLHARGTVAIVTLMWVVVFAVAAWHSEGAAQYAPRIRPDVAPAAIASADKLHVLFAEPLTVATVFAKTMLAVPGMIYSTIARFGWNDINPNPLLHVLVTIWCLGVIYLDRRAIAAIAWPTAGLMLLTFMAQFVLVVVTTWLVWTETTSPMVTGLQGRYFLPALICGVLGIAALMVRPFVAIADRGQTSAPSMPSLVAIGALTLLGGSLLSAVLGEFYGVQGFHAICLHELCKPD